MDKWIWHGDVNNFFVAVLLRRKPWLKGKRLIVGGRPETRHGIVLSKSTEVRPFKVPVGAALWQARQLCPDVLIEPMTNTLYDECEWASEDFRNIIWEYSAKVEMFGPDGAWADMTGAIKQFGSPVKLALEIQQRMEKELGFTISQGFRTCIHKRFSKV